ncbi:hypothetical protein J3A84_06700 [Proteiniclasticum sp. SCR006]|uniref:Uncharacterized protein n=1 Tax=Proteiniclasticum aestuarii TaxID=2817862 RepID=A0A939HAG0_9CLOT|nr:hypothetical protein [Proteiniclasticum aestuarii]MBO1264715.1 hypothetical protein [Proteiniclasticum aestuarii]
MKKYNMHYINDRGQLVHPEEALRKSWKMKPLPEEKEYRMDEDSGDYHRKQRRALSIWAMKMKW